MRLKHWGRWVSAAVIVVLLVALAYGASQGDISYRDIPYYLVSPIILQGLVGTIVLAVVAQVLGQIPQIDWLHPWLPTYRWFDVADVLRDPVAWGSFRLNALLQGAYVLVFGTLAWARFTSKDVLS